MRLSRKRACIRWDSLFWSSIFILFFLLAPHAVAQVIGQGGHQATDSGPASSDAISHAILLAGSYLENSCNRDGKFVYLVDVNSGQQSRSYNIIRHAGAMYALAMFNRSHPNDKAFDALDRAASFLRKNYVGQGVRPDQLIVWAKPLPQRSVADLGATALGLVALVELEKARPNSVPLSQLQALGRFVLFMQREDGSFVSKYRGDSGPVKDFESLYYPGEAALGLLYLYELDHSQIWLNAAARAISYLAKARVGLTDVPPDHWALIATAKFLPYYELSSSPSSREELIRHAIQICGALMKDQVNNPAATAFGAFDFAGRTAPVATRMEGLLAALEFVSDKQMKARIMNSVDLGIGFLLRAEFVDGPYAGGMPQAVAPSVAGTYEIRIDYVQHALCAWLRYAARGHNQ